MPLGERTALGVLLAIGCFIMMIGAYNYGVTETKKGCSTREGQIQWLEDGLSKYRELYLYEKGQSEYYQEKNEKNGAVNLYLLREIQTLRTTIHKLE